MLMKRIPPRLEFADTTVPADRTRQEERQSPAGHDGVDRVPFKSLVSPSRIWQHSAIFVEGTSPVHPRRARIRCRVQVRPGILASVNACLELSQTPFSTRGRASVLPRCN